jgi:hypothetical protein
MSDYAGKRGKLLELYTVKICEGLQVIIIATGAEAFANSST